MAQPTDGERRAVPYSSFSTVENFIERLSRVGIPAQIDRGFIGGSGANQSQMMATLKFFGLVDEEHRPTELLHDLVEKPEARTSIYRSLVEEHYGGVLALGERASQAMLEQWFREQGGVTGDTSRKAQTFFINLAKAGEIEVSPFFRPARATSNSARRKPTRRSSAPVELAPATSTQPPPSAGGPAHVHPALLASLSRIPNAELGGAWTQRERDLYLETFGNLLDLFHPVQDEEEV